MKVVALTETERQFLIWEAEDYFEVRSGSFVVTSSKPKPQQPGWKMVHFLFDEAATGSNFSGDMCLSGDIGNGPALLLLYRRGEEMSPYGVISMINRAWVHQVPLMDISLYRNTAKYKRLSEPPIVSALGVFAQIAYAVGKSVFTDQEKEAKEMVDVLHRMMHKLAMDYQFYWDGPGGASTGKL